MKKLISTTIVTSSLFIAAHCYAWSNYFTFVNNFDVPVKVSFHSTVSSANIHMLCAGESNNVIVPAGATSCKFQFTDGRMHWYSTYDSNQGTITIENANDSNTYCTIPYYYSQDVTQELNGKRYADEHSESFYTPTCKGDFNSNMLSVVNDDTIASFRSLAENLIADIDGMKAAQTTESQAEADCHGADNCLILSPTANISYVTNGSSLQQALNIQSNINQYEPLNFEQFIGGHNSAISRHYTTSTEGYNLSDIDPDAYADIPTQLNDGVRQIELDIEWANNTVSICHNHVSDSSVAKTLLCNNSLPFAGKNDAPLNQLANWANTHPDDLVLVYFDVNESLAGHKAAFDQALQSTLRWQTGEFKGQSMLFTPQDAQQAYGSTALPAYKLSAYHLTHDLHKNIMLVNDDGGTNGSPDLKGDSFVFTAVANSTETPLYEKSIKDFINTINKYGADKYAQIKQLFAGDPEHFNLYRLNADRTVIDYISSVGNTSADDYRNYFTSSNIYNILHYPVNILALNMLGATCGSNDCNTHPTDPRLYSLLWSWGLGYPVVNGAQIAYIDPVKLHFENNNLKANTDYNVLCVLKNANVLSPIQALNWHISRIHLTQTNQPSEIQALAENACQRQGYGDFAAPVTSYWFDDVVRLIAAQHITTPILINYIHSNNHWLANHQHGIVT
ncbi:PI-PLC domain-containing protein [Facilibium subflavum]|uniref:hypothetical protein n=1 Tax=Facilibium subflavum TaxID=2219058 RepID=UPI000E6463F9|nr:hypothetical protein [Facilibium subflavum]